MDPAFRPLFFGSLAAVVLFLLIYWRWGTAPAVVTALSGFAVIYLALSLVVVRSMSEPPMEVKASRGEPVFVARRPRQQLGDGYISSSACRECHPENHASWHASYHRTMTQVASTRTALTSFDGVEVRVGDQQVQLEVEGDQLWATMDDLDAPPADRPKRIRRPIALTTGSHHMQIYWYATGQSRVLGQLPIVYLTADDQWIPAAATLLQAPVAGGYSNTGRWNQSCVYCHSTHGRTAPTDTGEVDTQAAEFGISCEACHGPAADHVDFHRGQPTPGQLDPIVHPAKLSNQLSSQVCGACHSFTAALTLEEYQHDLLEGYRYRPGDDITETRLVEGVNDATRAHLARSGGDHEIYFRSRFWSDGMVRTAGREFNGLVGSPCYTAKSGGMTCYSCHSMHHSSDDSRTVKEWADDQLKPEALHDGGCTQCHSADSYQSTGHTHHRAESSGSRCYNCHMPHTTYGLLKSVRSHQIDRPSVSAELATGRPNACNLCHLNQTLGWTAEHLTRWYGAPEVELSLDQKSVSAVAMWSLTGDAGLRALAAIGMGWKPAVEASGDGWMAPLLASLLEDPYDAVRYCAARSLRQIEAYQELRYDHVGTPLQRARVASQVLETWNRQPRAAGLRQPATLIDPEGKLRQDVFSRLRQKRDNAVVNLAE